MRDADEEEDKAEKPGMKSFCCRLCFSLLSTKIFEKLKASKHDMFDMGSD